jgi:hypothetical protein
LRSCSVIVSSPLLLLLPSKDSGSGIGFVELFGDALGDTNLLSELWVVSGRRHCPGLFGGFTRHLRSPTELVTQRAPGPENLQDRLG